MNKALLQAVVIIILSGVAFLLMHFAAEWPLKKALLIAGGAGAAMILIDVVILPLVKKGR